MINTINHLIKSTYEISEKYKTEIIKSGIDFNIISIIGMENNERYTHSAIIAELLNPNGKHGNGDKFLKLFIQTCLNDEFEYQNENKIKVETEKYIGEITIIDGSIQYTSRTFLDIVITDIETNKSILIENKIWAENQKYQLERYSKFNPHTLIYLTINGNEYLPNNTGVKYLKFSYKVDIINWLNKCIEAVNQKLPKTALTIEIYKDVVEKITNQNAYKNMNNEIKDIVLLNEENFEAAERIYLNILEIQQNFQTHFLKSLENSLMKNNFELEGTINQYKYYIGLDSNEIFLGFKLADKEIETEEEKVQIFNAIKSFFLSLR